MKKCVKYNFDRIILTQGAVLTLLGLLVQAEATGRCCGRGGFDNKSSLSPAAVLIKQCAAPEHKLFSHRDRTVTIQAGPIKTFCSRNKNGWQ